MLIERPPASLRKISLNTSLPFISLTFVLSPRIVFRGSAFQCLSRAKTRLYTFKCTVYTEKQMNCVSLQAKQTSKRSNGSTKVFFTGQEVIKNGKKLTCTHIFISLFNNYF